MDLICMFAVVSVKELGRVQERKRSVDNDH